MSGFERPDPDKCTALPFLSGLLQHEVIPSPPPYSPASFSLETSPFRARSKLRFNRLLFN